MSIEEIYEQKCNDNSDICQHLPTLKEYAEKCDVVIELGMRSIVSTWAFLAAKPKILVSVDIHHPTYYLDYDQKGCNLELVKNLSEEQGTYFEFMWHDSITVHLPRCDLMFFDTLHTYEQLSAELKAHGDNVNKYLVFHDTETYKDELMPAINDFLKIRGGWIKDKIWFNNNGLLILKQTKNVHN